MEEATHSQVTQLEALLHEAEFFYFQSHSPGETRLEESGIPDLPISQQEGTDGHGKSYGNS